MQRAIVTVKLEGSDQEFDLEVPAELPSQELANLITFNLRPDRAQQQEFAIRCLKPEPLRRTLRSDESLAAAGLWDGAYLMIEPLNREALRFWPAIVREWVAFMPEPIALLPDPGTDLAARRIGHVDTANAETLLSAQPEPQFSGVPFPEANTVDQSLANPSPSLGGELNADEIDRPNDGYAWKRL